MSDMRQPSASARAIDASVVGWVEQAASNRPANDAVSTANETGGAFAPPVPVPIMRSGRLVYHLIEYRAVAEAP